MDFSGDWTQTPLDFRRLLMRSSAHPIRYFANEERDGSDARRHDTTISSSSRFECCRMWREPAPTDSAGKAQTIEMGRVVFAHTLPQDLPLPSIRGNLESLKLAQYFQQTAFAVELCSRSDVLPSWQPAHELRRSRWLDLLAQGAKRKAMNARQQSPIAPLRRAIMP